MGKTNGRQRRKNIERLADALQDCFDEAANAAAERAANTAAERAANAAAERAANTAAERAANAAAERAASAVADRFDAEWRPLVDKQNETLRMIWRQCGGKPEQRLPIDD